MQFWPNVNRKKVGLIGAVFGACLATAFVISERRDISFRAGLFANDAARNEIAVERQISVADLERGWLDRICPGEFARSFGCVETALKSKSGGVWESRYYAYLIEQYSLLPIIIIISYLCFRYAIGFLEIALLSLTAAVTTFKKWITS
jgi:hypothetical protein